MKSVLLSLCAFATLLFTGCTPSYEKQLSEALEREEWEYTNEQFNKAFTLIENMPETLSHKFDMSKIDGEIRIVTSEDGNVRAYVLERCGFGGNPSESFDTRTLVQYRDGDKVFTRRMFENYPIVERIYKLSDGYYAFVEFWGVIAAGAHYHYQVRVYNVCDEWLMSVPIAVFSDEDYSDRIELSWVDGVEEKDDIIFSQMIEKAGDAELDEIVISYDEPSKTLSVANTVRSKITNNSVLSGTYSKYQWDENYLHFNQVK